MMTEETHKIVEKLLNEELPEGFKQEKEQLLAKLTAEPSTEAVGAYSLRKNINLDEAKKRLQENYQKEVEEVQFKEIALRLSNSMKMLSPKMLGLEQRELGREEKVKRAVALAESANSRAEGAVREAKEAVHNAKAEAYEEIIEKINKELDLSGLVRITIDMQMEIDSLKNEIQTIKQNTIANRIKRFFGIK